MSAMMNRCQCVEGHGTGLDQRTSQFISTSVQVVKCRSLGPKDASLDLCAVSKPRVAGAACVFLVPAASGLQVFCSYT
ncbi:hypothetical protein KC335_g41 [Hortaea werneckii]|nr:hypothetical protein KC335_g41 [Hortaea werneckii]